MNLVNGGDKYIGEYVCTESFSKRDVISHDKDPIKCIKKANAKGYEDPVLIYMMDPNINYFYKLSAQCI